MQQISGMDEFFLHFERSGLPMHVGSIAIFDASKAPQGPPTFSQIREALRQSAERSPMLRKRLFDVPLHVDRPFWLEAQKLEIDEHVRHASLSRPRSWARFCSEAARLFEAPLSLERPLWETIVITDLDGIDGVPRGGFALLTKCHHALLDGVAGAQLMDAFLDSSPLPVQTEPADERPPDTPPGVLELASSVFGKMLSRTGTAAELTVRTLPSILKTQVGPLLQQSSADEETTPSTNTPIARTIFNGTPSSARVFGGIRLDLEEVQALRKAVAGATLNDVILAICGGALRRYLEATDGPPVEPLVAAAPVSVRSEDAEIEGGNQVSMMTASLGTEIADPLARLAEVGAKTRTSKKASNDMGATTMLDAADLIPSALGELAARAFRTFNLSSQIAPFFNCVVTNVRGPEDPLYLAGATMVANYGLGPVVDGMGLIHPVLSYDGGITISFTSCPTMLREPALYQECIQGAFEELKSAARVSDPDSVVEQELGFGNLESNVGFDNVEQIRC